MVVPKLIAVPMCFFESLLHCAAKATRWHGKVGARDPCVGGGIEVLARRKDLIVSTLTADSPQLPIDNSKTMTPTGSDHRRAHHPCVGGSVEVLTRGQCIFIIFVPAADVPKLSLEQCEAEACSAFHHLRSTNPLLGDRIKAFSAASVLPVKDPQLPTEHGNTMPTTRRCHIWPRDPCAGHGVDPFAR